MDWNKGFSALYALQKVDPVSWRDAGSFDLLNGTISRSSGGLVESADLTMTENPGECWVRVYLQARQGNGGERVPLFTGLASAPQRSLNGNSVSYRVACYSALKPIDDVLTPRGFFIPAGVRGADAAAELLQIGPAPVEFDAFSPTLREPIVSEDKDTYLTMAQKILDVIGWRLYIGGDGRISIQRKATTESAVFDEHENDSIEVSLTDTNDWYSAPNCIRVIFGSDCVELKDETVGDDLSIPSRKRARGGSGEIWAQEKATSLSDDATLEEYAARRLKELQSPTRKISYSRRFRPDVTIGDKVRLHLPGHGIDDVFTVTTQRVTLGYNARVTEEAEKA